MRKFLLSLILLSFSAIAQTDIVEIVNFGKKEGLLLSVIDCIAKDDDGFVWVGGASNDLHILKNTKKSLPIQRFNGVSFNAVFLPEKKDRYINVEQLIKREDGNFFVLCRNSKESHLYTFDPVSTKFERFKTGSAPHWSSKLFLFQSEYYFISQENDLLKIKKITKNDEVVTLFSFKENQTKYTIEATSILLFLGDNIIISDDNFPLKVFNRSGELLKEYPKNFFPIPSSYLRKHVFIEEYDYNPKGCLFTLRYFYQEYQFSKDGLEVSIKDKSEWDQGQKCFVSDQKNNSFIISEINDKIKIIDSSRIKFKGKQGSMSIKSFFSSDLNKELWYGTANASLAYIKFPSSVIERYLPGISVRSINEYNENEVIITTDLDGWWLLNKTNKQIKALNFINPHGKFNPSYSLELLMKDDCIWSSYGSNLVEIDKRTSKLSLSKHYPATCLNFLNDSTIIYGTEYFNLMKYSIKTKKHTELIGTDSLWIQDIEIVNNEIFMATNRGLYSFNPISEKLKKYPQGKVRSFYLVIKRLSNKELLLGSKKGDIYKYDIQEGNFELMYKDQEDAGIASINFDEDTNWWINTFDGIVKFNPENEDEIKRFSTFDGLVHNESNRYSANFIDEKMYVGTVSGFSVFDPSKLYYQIDTSQLILLSSKIFNVEKNKFQSNMNRLDFEDNIELVLPSTQRSLELEFGIINGEIGKGYHLEYRLNKGRWVSIGESRNLNFTNLAAGSYALEMRLSNFSGTQIGSILKLKVVSEKFFYQTIWFYVLILLLLIGVVVWYAFEMKKRGMIQEKFSQDLIGFQENEKIRISKELHDSLGQQLTLIKKMATNSGDIELTKLTGSALDEVRGISRNLYPSLLNKFGLTETIKELVNTIDEQTDLFFTLDVDSIDEYFSKDQALNVYRFVQESLSNVLKHANAKAVYVILKKTRGKVKIEIRDNGKGFEKLSELKLNSLGLKTMEERTRILKGQFLITSELGRGTVIKAYIPID
jgi:signal transduction histidine kinase